MSDILTRIPNTRIYLPASIAPPSARESTKAYVVLFNEGPSYLYIDALGSGSYSVTMLVMSLADNQIYVRKLHDVRKVPDEGYLPCDDELNAVVQSHVPQLLSSKYYLQTVPVPPEAPITYVTAATIWKYCNGGMVNDILRDWDRSQRIPEAVIWNLLMNLLEALLETNQAGVAQGDTHSHNFLLHWPGASLVPDVYVSDFGVATKKPQELSDEDFESAFDGLFRVQNHRCLPVSDTLSDQERDRLELFYSCVRQDMANTIRILSALMLSPRFRVPRSDRYLQEHILRLAREGKGARNYSQLLIAVIAAWINIIRSEWKQPPEMFSALIDLLDIIRYEARIEINKLHALHNTSPDHPDFEQLDMLRAYTRESTPAIWRTSRDLLNPSSPVRHAPRLDFRDQLEGRRKKQTQFTPLGTRAWNAANPGITIEREHSPDAVELRRGQFHVIEIEYDADMSRWYLARQVDTASDSEPLDPVQTAKDAQMIQDRQAARRAQAIEDAHAAKLRRAERRAQIKLHMRLKRQAERNRDIGIIDPRLAGEDTDLTTNDPPIHPSLSPRQDIYIKSESNSSSDHSSSTDEPPPTAVSNNQPNAKRQRTNRSPPPSASTYTSITIPTAASIPHNPPTNRAFIRNWTKIEVLEPEPETLCTRKALWPPSTDGEDEYGREEEEYRRRRNRENPVKLRPLWSDGEEWEVGEI